MTEAEMSAADPKELEAKVEIARQNLYKVYFNKSYLKNNYSFCYGRYKSQ